MPKLGFILFIDVAVKIEVFVLKWESENTLLNVLGTLLSISACVSEGISNMGCTKEKYGLL